MDTTLYWLVATEGRVRAGKAGREVGRALGVDVACAGPVQAYNPDTTNYEEMVRIRVHPRDADAMCAAVASKQIVQLSGTAARVYRVTHVKPEHLATLRTPGQAAAADMYKALVARAGKECFTRYGWTVQRQAADANGDTSTLPEDPDTTLLSAGATAWDGKEQRRDGHLPADSKALTTTQRYLGVRVEVWYWPYLPYQATPGDLPPRLTRDAVWASTGTKSTESRPRPTPMLRC